MTAEAAFTLTLARPEEAPLLEGLMQFYIYDFSEMEPPGSTGFELDGTGRFEPYPYLDRYWSEEGRIPLILRVDGHPAGFALINSHSHRDDGHVERNMGEFFVARKHRGRGLADWALHEILARYPGRWEIAIAQRNARAIVFWPRAIKAAGNVSEIEEIQGDGIHWTGPIWTFVAR
ncbi:putative acetyltransferase [Caulobacter ginsengisoli]|uniref:Acetyltransferase n=1 Tax=Caulobacter ginsengisoli TaxID=400775 RepID=A0ABU0IR10_9CAUL|nr:GNAT family N-acetyltransferase [Caulobacter ginsengisoli]MDQ0464451.1 putative acetyltransferase [Caulobacter ginsengisoli]